jgi:ABC-2 type transport system permease protein
MRRLLKIALREYLSYVRTVGFWLSMAGVPLIMGIAIMAPTLIARSAPTPKMVIIDLSGRNLTPVIIKEFERQQSVGVAKAMAASATAAAGPKAGEAIMGSFDAQGLEAAEATFRSVAPKVAETFKAPAPGVEIVPVPDSVAAATSAEAAGKALKPYLADATSRGLTYGAIISADTKALSVDFWSRNLGLQSLDDRLTDILRDEDRRMRLTQAGVSDALLKDIDAADPTVRLRSPKSDGDQVSMRDRLPTVIGFVMAMGLWTVILSGAGILLNSVVEDKSSRVLEVLLASASTTEIMGGKILGVAAVTFSVLAIWLTLGTAMLLTNAPGLSEDLVAILATKGLAYYFGFYLVGGYLIYACVFTAIGAFCETTREAQTLVGPMMLILSIPMIFMSQSITHPDMPIIKILCWVPPFTPFMMMVRAASGPTLFELVGTGLGMAAFIAITLWLSGKAFRVGALSTSKLDPKAIFMGILRRRPKPV